MPRSGILRQLQLAISVLAGLMMLAVPLAAHAMPLEPTLSLAGLSTLLQAAPDGIPGYMKTVLKGSTIETIPVTVEAVTMTGSLPSSLILFEASGPMIDKYGGIVAGMSGSPIYVTDGGVDKLIGALSYGDTFTKGGSGLATPIEYMTQLESDYAPSLASPSSADAVVSVPAAVSNRLGIPSSLQVTPLAAVEVGGLPSNDPMFVKFQSKMAARGIEVMQTTPMGSGNSSFSADFEGGASVAALQARGDLWVGDVGTVTYATSDTVLAFGHPVLWNGQSGLEMANAWVDGIWPSLDTPYKIAEPGAPRGTITQDRMAGVLGLIGVMPPEATITAHAVNAETGRSYDTTTFMPAFVIDSGASRGSSIPEMAAYMAGLHCFDSNTGSGSAATTTTVVVSDGTRTYTLVRPNVWDTDGSITQDVVGDVSDMVSSFQYLNDVGFVHAHLVSVDLQVRITTNRNNAYVSDVVAPSGLKTGSNRITISMKHFPSLAVQTLDTTLTLPAGMPADGTIIVTSIDPAELADSAPTTDSAASSSMGDFGDPSDSFPDTSTVSDVVDQESNSAPNSTLYVTYVPSADAFDPTSWVGDPTDPSAPITMQVPTPWYTLGEVEKDATSLTLTAPTTSMTYNGSVRLTGKITGQVPNAVVVVTSRSAGDRTDHVIKRIAVSSPGTFSVVVGKLRRNTTVTASFGGSTNVMHTSASVKLKVQAKIGLRASATHVSADSKVTLRATCLAYNRTDPVEFDALLKGVWTRQSLQSVDSHGVARMEWQVPAGVTAVRALFPDSATNALAVTRSVLITGS